MSYRCPSTLDPEGQPPHRRPRRPGAVRSASILLAIVGLWAACHRPVQPWDPDPRLPPAFDSPAATFRTWQEATRAGDREAVGGCWWDGLGSEERDAYLEQNLRPEARELLREARLVTIRPVTAVEIRFAFESQNGKQYRGVMVRTGAGWKIQSW